MLLGFERGTSIKLYWNHLREPQNNTESVFPFNLYEELFLFISFSAWELDSMRSRITWAEVCLYAQDDNQCSVLDEFWISVETQYPATYKEAVTILLWFQLFIYECFFFNQHQKQGQKLSDYNLKWNTGTFNLIFLTQNYVFLQQKSTQFSYYICKFYSFFIVQFLKSKYRSIKKDLETNTSAWYYQHDNIILSLYWA